MKRSKLRYFVDSVDLSYTQRVYAPDGWLGCCGGKMGPTPAARTRLGAFLWIVRRAWLVADDDVRLDRLLSRGR